MNLIPVPGRGGFASIRNHGVYFMAPLRQCLRDLMNMNTASRRAGERLIRRDVENPHFDLGYEAMGASSPKKGPVRTLPKNATSSIRI